MTRYQRKGLGGKEMQSTGQIQSKCTLCMHGILKMNILRYQKFYYFNLVILLNSY